MTRRELFAVAGGTASALLAAQVSAAQSSKGHIGASPSGLGMRSRFETKTKGQFDIVEYAHEQGLSSVEANPPENNPAAIKAFRQKAESYKLHVIFDIFAPTLMSNMPANLPPALQAMARVRLPREQADVAAFEAGVKLCKEAGAAHLHSAMTGRRYEDFKTLDAYKKNTELCHRIIELAEPVLRKHQMKLAVENHKSWRAEEHAEWMKRLASEWVGVHFDFGNNVSFCEDPTDTCKTLLPYIISCHIKDMAVAPYEDGFLLSEVPMGEGFLDLKGLVTMLRGKDPNMAFNLEMITRDPLKVPIYTEQYWVTFGEMPGRTVAHMMDIVRKNPPKKPLPKTTGLSPEAALKLEDDNNVNSYNWARQNLNLA